MAVKWLLNGCQMAAKWLLNGFETLWIYMAEILRQKRLLCGFQKITNFYFEK
jgi:hypothetical protein